MSDRERYQQKMHDQLEQWKLELNSLKLKTKDVGDEAQAEMRQHIQSLEEKLKEGREKMKQLNESTGDAWESARHTVESALATLKSGFKEAGARFRLPK